MHRGISIFTMASSLLKCLKNILRQAIRIIFCIIWNPVATSSRRCTGSTVDAEEVKKFDANTEFWDGQFLLHWLNSLRVPLIRDGILSVSKRHQQIVSDPLSGFTILDIGCGGGILSEPLARLGAEVTGLDPGAQSIDGARERASKNPEIRQRLKYVCDTAENLAATDCRFDAVVASEVVEHVSDVQTFVRTCVQLTKTGGSLFFTTFNRTYVSYLRSIVLAEYVMGFIPRGTHDWKKFVKPDELITILESLNCRIVLVRGIDYNPFTKKFSWSKKIDNWYALHAVKL